jgi:ATP-dependent exoDNAse (exonuclease V) alpha subunit
MHKNIQKLRDNPETENAGKKWSEQEVNELLNNIKTLTFDEAALIHKRTPGSIKSKLLSIALSLINKKMLIDEITQIVKLSKESILDYMNKQPEQKSKKKSENLETNDNKLTGSEILELMQDTTTVSNLLDIPIKEPVKEIILNFEQESALNAFKTGKNIFLTGPAGTGKSVTLNKIKEYCIHSSKQFGITATTGTAAFILGGKTLHSYLGIGLAKESAEEIFKFVRYKLKHIAERLRECQVLIIDEISMLDAALFDKISDYLKYIRKNNKPFGGLQLVLTGDFCQLEPVSGDYCFKASEWEKLNLKTVYLHKLIRQDGDILFQNILSKVRYGKCTPKTFELLSKLKDKEFGEIKPTILYPRNFDVDKINKLESDKLIESGAKKQEYKLEYPKSKNKDKTQRWIKSLDIPEEVTFCVGDQVVVTTNVDQEEGIVNGTRGVVLDVKARSVLIKRINSEQVWIKYYTSTNAEDSNLSVSYIPLKLAYALSIHKSQGMTLDAIEIDIGSKIFAAGQAYTALSRAQSLSSVKIKSISMSSFIVNPDVLIFYKEIEKDVKIKNDKFITKQLNMLIHNILTHNKLENSLDFIWDFIPVEDEKLLKFFDGYSKEKIEIELDEILESNDTNIKILKEYIYEIKKYMIDIELVREKLREFIL